MAKSVRISDELYSMAKLQAAIMHRSVAQQLEYWASLGRVMELRGNVPEQTEVAIAQQRLRDHDKVRNGKARARDMHFIPAEWVRDAKLTYPKNAFREYMPKTIK